MAGRHRDPLRHLTWFIVLSMVVLAVVVLVCYFANIPSAEFWQES